MVNFGSTTTKYEENNSFTKKETRKRKIKHAKEISVKGKWKMEKKIFLKLLADKNKLFIKKHKDK